VLRGEIVGRVAQNRIYELLDRGVRVAADPREATAQVRVDMDALRSVVHLVLLWRADGVSVRAPCL
jgi:hypothetical protein